MMVTHTPTNAFRSQSGSVILSEKTPAMARGKTKNKRSVASKRKPVKAVNRDS